MVTPKVGKPELRFLCSAHSLMVLYIYEKFHEKYLTFFNLQSGHKYMVEIATFNVQRAVTPKVTRVTVHQFCTLSHGALNLCKVSSKCLLWGFQLTERTLVRGRNGYFQYLGCSKGRNSKDRLTRVVVLVLCTSFHGALHLWEIS